MRKISVTLLATVILAASVLIFEPHDPTVKADQGYAKVYILCLSGIGGVWTDPQKVKEGAIKALTYKMEYSTPLSMPYAHPKRGKSPPFYSVDYAIVEDWDSYRNLIESDSYREAIIVNTHGELIPIPSGYPDPAAWVNNIADAMLHRRISWVHVSCYPFFYVWHQGQTSYSEWPGGGPIGFQTLMSNINLNGVTCWSPNESQDAPLTPAGTNSILAGGWPDVPESVKLSRPIRWSDFQQNMIMSIYDYGLAGDRYCAGAVVAFAAAAGTRGFTASEMSGFGAYIHIGTLATYGGLGDADVDKGYVGTAAALLTEVNAFEGRASMVGDLSKNYGEQFLFAVPIIAYYFSDASNTYVYFQFAIFGSLQYSKSSGQGLDCIHFMLNSAGDLPAGCQVMMDTSLSKNGYGTGANLANIYVPEELVLLTKVALYMISFVPVIGQITYFTTPIFLFSNWLEMVTGGGSERGVNGWDTEVDFTYTPQYTKHDLGSNWRYDYETITTIVLKVPRATNWQVTSFDWHVSLLPLISAEGESPHVDGDASTAIWHGGGDELTVFYDDFEDGMGSWQASDGYLGTGGEDYWGIFDSPHIRWLNRMWCARQGSNSVYGGLPNIDVKRYDKDMSAYVKHWLDLRPYSHTSLYFRLENWVQSGDYLEAGKNDGCYYALRTYSTSGFWQEGPISFTGSSVWRNNYLEFHFVTNNDNSVDYGAFINDVELKGVLPNDASTLTDAGDDFNTATSVSIAGNVLNYAGYLEDEDWYSIYLDDEYGKQVNFSLHSSSGSSFVAELWSPNNVRRYGPATSFSYYRSSPTDDPAGTWRIRIYANKGFGQYDFDVSKTGNVLPPGGGGGGGGGGGCIAEGTLVTMADGSCIPVEMIKKGDTVLGYDPVSRSFLHETVLTVTSTKVWEIIDINNGMLRLTPSDQPIYVRNSTYQGWLRDPKELKVGWEIFDAITQEWVEVRSVNYLLGRTRVYDFMTDGCQTYIANSFLLLDKGHKK